MKWMKKIATLALALALIVSCFSMVSHAANSIQFHDLNGNEATAVGETCKPWGKVVTDSAKIGNIEIEMTYDTTMLRFKEGDNITEEASGKLLYKTEVSGNQNGEIRFDMQFIALKEGTTKISIETYTINDSNGKSITGYAEGDCTIAIKEGDPTKIPAETTNEHGTTITVGEKTYTVSESFKESDIPNGFEESEFENHSGENYKSITIPGTDLQALYLVETDSDNSEGQFFLYNGEDGSFYPMKYVELSGDSSIVILQPEGNVGLPAPYVEEMVFVNGCEIKSWRNPETQEFCVLYAMNLSGEKLFYQYDDKDDTYQRFTVPTIEKEEEDALLAKLSNKLGSPLDVVVFGSVFVIMLIVIIVLSVKLYNRNAELDELYDEYGIDLFDDDDTKNDGSVVHIDDEDDLEEIDYGTGDEEESSEQFAEAEPELHAEQLGGLEEFAHEEPKTMEEAMKTLAEAVKSDEEYWNDDSDADFEMNFIDLDD